MSPSRSILFVGEGNFSYSASLCQSLSGSDTSITATCLQQEDEALRHDGSATNVQIIREAGGTVLFNIDCTRLGEHQSLKGNLFDLVIFNFPHCGRKSGVKKNRELLKNFFLSCVQVLSEDGEIHVSLCNGQGGTPADQPKREWHNSWQVVAMASEAQLILTNVQPFENYQSYKCTGYRSQDKGFHVEKALLHIFTRSLPFTPPHTLTVEETVEGEEVKYQMPAELSDYMFRGFLKSGSHHPVKLAQNFVLEGLAKNWCVSMMTETIPFLLSGKQVQTCCKIDSTQCCLIQLLQRDTDPERNPLADKKCTIPQSNSCTKNHGNGGNQLLKNKGADVLKHLQSLDIDPEMESDLYVLRPSLIPPLEDLITKHKMLTADCLDEPKCESSQTLFDEQEFNAVTLKETVLSLWGISGVVFRNVPINTWALPVFHELLLSAALPSDPDPLKILSKNVEKLLGAYGVSLKPEQDYLCIVAEPMGLVGKIWLSPINKGESHSCINIGISINLDLLAVLLYALPDWRILWSHDPRFYKEFSVQTTPGTLYCPLSLFPENFRFDISFWTGPSWDERKFYSAVRESSCGTVQQVKLIDTFSHPDLIQTSFCYRLVYHSHTHALSHTQVLTFHKQLETVLSTWLQVTVR